MNKEKIMIDSVQYLGILLEEKGSRNGCGRGETSEGEGGCDDREKRNMWERGVLASLYPSFPQLLPL